MSFLIYRWDKCCIFTIGGTYVDLIEGRSDKRRSDKRRSDKRRSDKRRSDKCRSDNGGRKVAASFLSFNVELKIAFLLSK
jgi:hypothetical protein